MISAVSILKASPEFSSEHPLLDSIATIFSDSDVAQTKLTSLMAKRDDFHNKRRRAEAMEQENLSVRDQIRNLTVEYDVCEDVVKRLEREIAEQRSKMALILDEAETLKKTLLSNRSATRAVVDELAGLKSDYVDWTKEIRDSEEKQGECLLKWEQLRRLFC
ncbi:Heat shock transcription factor [Dorcoceras hygrometricum]|uniref:Heat shock transcription factor n=1 Tax=Dorcoceras hygrometricum TaxID=472368 RepID=A0A2Z7CG70_9LAMI|nr:Heat shock transcription factor [Dorcoceras hygrometricum]